MKKMFLSVAMVVALFTTQAEAQKKPKEKTPSVERSLSTIEKASTTKQTGPAEIDANLTKNYGATHHHLPVGSIIKVRNPKNEKVVMVEIESNIKDRNAMYIIKLSVAATEKIGAEGKSFPVEIEYDDKGGAKIVEETTIKETTPPVKEGAQTHVVKSGDTLSLLAKTYSVTVAGIKKANNLKNDKIKIGQKLKIPVSKDKK